MAFKLCFSLEIIPFKLVKSVSNMFWRLFIIMGVCVCVALEADLSAQVTYRGVAKKTPKKADTTTKAVKKPPAPKPAAAKPPAPLDLKPRKVLIFPKTITAFDRVDFAGFRGPAKNYVPNMVVFRLRHSIKPDIKIKEYAVKISRVVPVASSGTMKLEITTPKNLPAGYYDIFAIDVTKKTAPLGTNILVSGIVQVEQSFFTNISNGVITTFPMLLIKGHGFGAFNKTNLVYFDKTKVTTVISWNDSIVKLMVPEWMNTGNVYSLRVRNSKGVELPKNPSNDPVLDIKFVYKGIRENSFNADLTEEDLLADVKTQSATTATRPVMGVSKTRPASLQVKPEQKGKIAENKEKAAPKPVSADVRSPKTGSSFGSNWLTYQTPPKRRTEVLGSEKDKNKYLTVLQIKGLGFGETKKDSKIFLNSTEASQIVSWSDTLITVKTTSFRPGKYISKIFLHPNDRRKKNVFRSRDSFYIWGRIPYQLHRIVGASYAVSLKKSELPVDMMKKNTSYIFTLPQDAFVELAFYDATGKNMYAKLFSDDALQTKGRYKVTYNTSDLSSGKYLLVFTVNKDKFMKVYHPIVVR